MGSQKITISKRLAICNGSICISETKHGQQRCATDMVCVHTGKNRYNGMVLILVLWILMVLVVLVLALAQNTRLDNSIRLTMSDKVTARWLSRAGVYQAIGQLANDDNTTDGQWDNWYDNPRLFKDFKLTGGTFTVYADRFRQGNKGTYGVEDEASKLNVNTATLNMLLKLPNMTDTLAQAIIQWRDDPEHSYLIPAGTVGGSLNGTVNNNSNSNGSNANKDVLANINSRNRVSSATSSQTDNTSADSPGTLRCLALVEGMTNKILYGEDTNMNGIMETNENDGDKNPPQDNEDGILDRGLLGYVTVYSYELNCDGQGQRRININKADIDTLEEKLQLAPPYALWLVENRPFNSIADIVKPGDTQARLPDIAPNNNLATGGANVAVRGGNSASSGTGRIRRTRTARTRTTSRNNVNTPGSHTGTKPDNEKIQPVRPTLAVFRRIADHITVTYALRIAGRININTANSDILQCLPGIDEHLAQQIISKRSVLPDGFRSIAEVLAVQGMTPNKFKAIAKLITVRSYVFTIRSQGREAKTGITCNIEAVVQREKGRVSVIYWHEVY